MLWGSWPPTGPHGTPRMPQPWPTVHAKPSKVVADTWGLPRAACGGALRNGVTETSVEGVQASRGCEGEAVCWWLCSLWQALG